MERVKQLGNETIEKWNNREMEQLGNEMSGKVENHSIIFAFDVNLSFLSSDLSINAMFSLILFQTLTFYYQTVVLPDTL